MTISRAIRQGHRWIPILFTLPVVAGFTLPAVRPEAERVSDFPLAPMAALLLSGLYLFVQPCLTRAERQG